MLKKQIVHFPVLILPCCCLRSYRSELRLRMTLTERKVAVSKLQLVSKLFLYPFNDRVSLPTKRTLVISIFKKLDRCIGITLDMVGSRNRCFQWHSYTF